MPRSDERPREAAASIRFTSICWCNRAFTSASFTAWKSWRVTGPMSFATSRPPTRSKAASRGLHCVPWRFVREKKASHRDTRHGFERWKLEVQTLKYHGVRSTQNQGEHTPRFDEPAPTFFVILDFNTFEHRPSALDLCTSIHSPRLCVSVV